MRFLPAADDGAAPDEDDVAAAELVPDDDDVAAAALPEEEELELPHAASTNAELATMAPITKLDWTALRRTDFSSTALSFDVDMCVL